MNANTIRAALIALLIAGGLSTACKLTASASSVPTKADTSSTSPAAEVCRIGHSC